MKWSFLFILLAALYACAIPAGKFDPEDIVWEESVMPAHWEQVFKNTIDGFQTCSTGIPRCYVFPETRFVKCDIYMIEVAGEASAWVFGFVEVRAVDDKSTSLKLGIHKSFATDKTFKRWRNYADGVYECLETETK
ncbi:MAG: hypothetical protein JRK53_19215 [Deltaproteobacteria bacterium]|nr:hypothetical protein [Deltaproteobacteria bacterium]MBW2286124.1 hypothetical protein [Deltaproteobacteria bacterium]